MILLTTLNPFRLGITMDMKLQIVSLYFIIRNIKIFFTTILFKIPEPIKRIYLKFVFIESESKQVSARSLRSERKFAIPYCDHKVNHHKIKLFNDILKI